MSHVPHITTKGVVSSTGVVPDGVVSNGVPPGASGASEASGASGPESGGAPERHDSTTTPRRTILVDGFNVLHAVLLGKDRDGRWWRQALREQLLDRVTMWQGAPADIWVAFDGARPHVSVWTEPVAMPSGPLEGPDGDRSGPRVHSVFVESADDWIVRRSRRTEHPERVVVVSADRKVAGRARSAGCEILTPWAFMARCPTSPAGSPDASDAPVSESPFADAPRPDASGADTSGPEALGPEAAGTDAAPDPGEPAADDREIGSRLRA